MIFFVLHKCKIRKSHIAKNRNWSVSKVRNSDHDIVLLDIACNPIKPKPTRHNISLWKKPNIYKIQKDLIVFGENFRDQTFDSIESMWNHFKTAVKRIIDQMVPTKMTRARHAHPWMNTKVRWKISQKQRPDEPKRREIEIGTKEYNRKYKERQEKHINSIWKT